MSSSITKKRALFVIGDPCDGARVLRVTVVEVDLAVWSGGDDVAALAGLDGVAHRRVYDDGARLWARWSIAQMFPLAPCL